MVDAGYYSIKARFTPSTCSRAVRSPLGALHQSQYNDSHYMRTVATQRSQNQRSGCRTVLCLVVLCMLGSAVACAVQPQAPMPTSTATLGTAFLRVNVLPAGAVVRLNGEEKGGSPLVLELPPGNYLVRVEHLGYEPLHRDIQLLPGQVLLIADRLRDVEAPSVQLQPLTTSVLSGQSILLRAVAFDNEAVVWMRLAIDGKLLAEARGSSLEYHWDTQGAEAGAHTILVEAQDAGGNVGQVTGTVQVMVAPTALPSPTLQATETPRPRATPAPRVTVHETMIMLSAYPYEPYLRERMDTRYNFRVVWLDRAAYEASNPRPRPCTLKQVILENEYLKLVFLPELGGRIYQCIFKPTGQSVFYQNTVLKPSYWGPLSREENWWLAAGGLEWALPVHEHGYEWGIPWGYEILRQADQATLILRDTMASDRLRAEIRVTLPADRAYFVIRPHLVNPTDEPISLQFWLSAALTLGSPTVSPETEFIYPTEQVIVHSTGDSALPGEGQVMPWPVVDGRDLSYYRNWRNWLGVFVPGVVRGYVGAYNHQTGLGIVRLFPPDIARGLKLFAFGADFPARSEYADDGSEYFELWGGPCRTFWPEDEVTIGAGQSLAWSEIWMPFRGIGGMDVANSDAVLKASLDARGLQIGIAVSLRRSAYLQLQWNGKTFHQTVVQLDPQNPLSLLVALPAEAILPGQLGAQLSDPSGSILLEYTKDIKRPE